MEKEVSLQDNAPLVSVIIPVFNGDLYIEACIRSVMCQTYENIEIIVVNDGSTDGSLRIIECCQRLDDRIICINQPNRGPALARSVAIDAAKGKYVQYLDADDILISDSVERLVRRAEETEADIVASCFYICYSDGQVISREMNFDELSGGDYYREILMGNAYWAVWANFHKCSLYLDFPIRIVPDLSYGEDAVLMTQLILFANKVVSLSSPILYYNKHSGSITASMDDVKYMHLRRFHAWIEKYVEEKNLSSVYREAFAHEFIRFVVDSIHWHQVRYICEDMKRLAKELDMFPSLYSLLNGRERKLLFFYKLSPLLGNLKLWYYYKKKKI